jgi:tetratricopeptide (TPR) repeat protein
MRILAAVLSALLVAVVTWGSVAKLRPDADLPSLRVVSSADPEVQGFLRQQLDTVAADTNDPSRWATLGMAYEANGFISASERCYQRALTIRQDEPKWWYRLAFTQARSGDVPRALETEQRAIVLNPSYGPLHWRRGMWLLDQGELDNAAQAFQRAVDVDAEDPAGWLGLARVSLVKRDPRRCIGTVQRLLSGRRVYDKATRRYALQLLGSAYLQLGRVDDAKVALTIGADSEPIWRDPWTDEVMLYRKGADAVAMEAATLMSVGHIDTAVTLLERLRDRSPADAAVLNHLATAYAAAGRFDDSMRTLTRALEQNPQSYETHVNLAAAYMHVNQLQLALKYADRAIALDPSLPKGHELKGLVLSQTGKRRDAIEQLQMAAHVDPRNVNTLLVIGGMQGELGEWREALATFQRAADANPLSVDAFVGIGSAEMHLGALDQAEAALLRANGLDAHHARVAEAQSELRRLRASGSNLQRR